MLKRFLLCAALTAVTTPTWAMSILTSIKPIQMITYELTKGVEQPDVLLPSTASPHDYALRPSDIKKIRQADLVIWFGEGLEPFMSSVVAGKAHVITISQNTTLPLYHFEEGHHHHDDDDDHDHGNIDPHFWLGAGVTAAVAKVITQQLVVLDRAHANQYQHNLATFISNLTATDRTIASQLETVKGKPYYVFHDAYGYFERHYGLSSFGHFTVSPERKPGAKTIAHIHETLAMHQHVCVFTEPQFQPAIMTAVMNGTSAKLGQLDPLGMNIKVRDGSYFEFLKMIAHHFTECLNP